MATQSKPDYIITESVDLDKWRKHVSEELTKFFSKGVNFTSMIKALRDCGDLFENISETLIMRNGNPVTVSDTKKFDSIMASTSRTKPVFLLNEATPKDQPKHIQHAFTIAKKCTKSNLKMVKSFLEDEANDFDDADMIAMQLRDEADHLELASMVRDGKLLQAANFMYDLDTGSRDEIPTTSYDWIEINVDKGNHTIKDLEAKEKAKKSTKLKR